MFVPDNLSMIVVSMQIIHTAVSSALLNRIYFSTFYQANRCKVLYSLAKFDTKITKKQKRYSEILSVTKMQRVEFKY